MQVHTRLAVNPCLIPVMLVIISFFTGSLNNVLLFASGFGEWLGNISSAALPISILEAIWPSNVASYKDKYNTFEKGILHMSKIC